jgi:hypothetical protein
LNPIYHTSNTPLLFSLAIQRKFSNKKKLLKRTRKWKKWIFTKETSTTSLLIIIFFRINLINFVWKLLRKSIFFMRYCLVEIFFFANLLSWEIYYFNIRSTTLLDSMRHKLVQAVQVQIVSIPKVHCCRVNWADWFQIVIVNRAYRAKLPNHLSRIQPQQHCKQPSKGMSTSRKGRDEILMENKISKLNNKE